MTASRNWWLALAGLALAGLALRLSVVAAPGYIADVQALTDWSTRLVAEGPAVFYARSDPGHSLYPPAYLLVLWLFDLILDGEALRLAIKASAIPADLGIGVLVALWARPRAGEKRALAAAAGWLLSPAAVFAGAYWGQMDALGIFAVLAAIFAAGAGRWGLAGSLSGIALMVKLQFGLAGYVLGFAAGMHAWRGRDARPLLRFVGAALVAAVGLALPFRSGPLDLLDLARRSAEAFPFSSLFAYNVWALAVGFVPDRWFATGSALLACGLVASLIPVLRRRDATALLTAGALAALAFYFLPTRAHERYVLPALALLLPLAALRPWLGLPYAVLSFGALASFVVVFVSIGYLPAPPAVHAFLTDRRAQVLLASLMLAGAAAAVAIVALPHAATVAAALRRASRLLLTPRPWAPSFRDAPERRRAPVMPRLTLAAQALVLVVPILFIASALAPELTVPVPTINDGNNHLLFIRRADEALVAGEHILDHWVPEMELGFPEFFYYQHLPHLAVVALSRATFGVLDLLTAFNLVRYALLVGLPLTVFWSMRRMGFSRAAAAFGGAVSPLVSAPYLFGFEYESYLHLGYGMYTQLWAMHLSFVVLALVHRTLQTGRGHAAAGAAFAVLALSHLAYAYMVAMSCVVLAIVGISRRGLLRRAAGLGLIAVLVAIVSAYMVIPFVLEREHLWISPYLPRARWDSYGAEQVLTWLLQGQLFDGGRLPVFTGLVALGACAAVVRRSPPALAALALFVVWLILYFGRATFGTLADLLPFREGVPMHRFIGMVQLAGILLIGTAGGALFELAALRLRLAGVAVATAALILALVPALGERGFVFSRNTEFMTKTKAALDRDIEGRRILDLLHGAPGRVYAGDRTNWGPNLLNLALSFPDLRFWDLLTFERLRPVAPPYYSWSTNADLLFDFDELIPAHYAVFNVRRVVAPRGAPLAPGVVPLYTIGPYVLYDAPGGGYAAFVAIVERMGIPGQPELLARNRAWLASGAPAAGRYVRYDYPAPERAVTVDAPGCPAGIVREDVIGPARFDLTVECATASTLVIKTTFHPNWIVRVDGREVPTFMTSPAYIGIEIPPGRHAVVAEYRAHPLKTPLAFLGLGVFVGAIVLRRRLDALVARLGQPAPQRDQEQEPREHEDEGLAEERADAGGDEREHGERHDPAAPPQRD